MTSLIDMRPGNNAAESLIKLITDSRLINITMLEIGSYQGQSAEIFINTGNIVRIYCVDPWQNGYDNTDAASFSDMVAVENAFDKRLQKFGEKVVKCKGTLSDFILHNFNSKIDLVYIDGNHQYNGYRDDLILIKNIIRPKIISGHDYVQGWEGVMRAVNEIVGVPDKVYEDGSWLKYMI